MPPTTHSMTSEKPDGMPRTWKPRLVNTPMPIMSATAIAVAVTVETFARSIWRLSERAVGLRLASSCLQWNSERGLSAPVPVNNAFRGFFPASKPALSGSGKQDTTNSAWPVTGLTLRVAHDFDQTGAGEVDDRRAAAPLDPTTYTHGVPIRPLGLPAWSPSRARSASRSETKSQAGSRGRSSGR